MDSSINFIGAIVVDAFELFNYWCMYYADPDFYLVDVVEMIAAAFTAIHFNLRTRVKIIDRFFGILGFLFSSL